MSEQAVISLVGLLTVLKNRVQNVKVYRRRCRNLILRCELLVDALREGDAEGSLGAAYADALNEARSILESVRDRVLRWANLNTVGSLLNQDDIRETVDELHRKVDTCVAAYHIRISQQLAQAQSDQSVASQCDIREIRVMIQDLLEALPRYMSGRADRSTLPHSAITVFQDIKGDIQSSASTSIAVPEGIQPPASTSSAIPEENIDSQSFVSESNAFKKATRSFCISLVTGLFADRRPPADYPHLPRLDFGGQFRITTDSQIIPKSVEPSSPVSGDSEYHSPRNSVVSGDSASTRASQHSAVRQSGPLRSERSSLLNSFGASGPLSSLKVALTTRVSTWTSGGQPPVITGATMEGFIHYLLLKRDDKDQQDIFFVAHTAFITPLHVLGRLIRIYDEGCHDIRARIMRLIKDWLNNQHVVLADEVLMEMGDFIVTVKDSDDPEELLLDVVEGIRQKAFMNSQPSLTISSFVPTTEYRPTPGQLAAALARLEGEKYRQILPAEYVAHAGGLPLYSPNLSAAIALNELIGKWIKSSILHERLGEGKKGLQERSKVMQFFVETAKECQALRAFSSLCIIMDALRSRAIARLHLTRNEMSISARRKHQTLIKFPDPDSDYSAYRRALSREGRPGCIPWHVVSLHDINAIIQHQRDVDEDHEPPLICVEKWARLRRRATAFGDYVPPQNEEMAVEYLRRELQSVSPGDDFNQVLQTTSRAVKKQEDEITARRTGLRNTRSS